MANIDIETGVVDEVFKPLGVAIDCFFDPSCDIRAVDPYGYINLRDAYENHNVPTVVSDEIASYNGIEDPDSIIGTPRDIFEAYRMNEAIQKADKAAKASKESVSSSKDEAN